MVPRFLSGNLRKQDEEQVRGGVKVCGSERAGLGAGGIQVAGYMVSSVGLGLRLAFWPREAVNYHHP